MLWVLIRITSTNVPLYLQIAELLLQSGAEPSIGDSYENTPLHRAASKGHVKMVKLLLQYQVDVNYKDKVGNTPL